MHEQSRPDRDFYVSILMENVEIGKRKNFRKKSADTHSGQGTPFDPQSIMIYGPKDFGIQDSTTGERKTTIQPLDPNVEIRYLAQPKMLLRSPSLSLSGELPTRLTSRWSIRSSWPEPTRTLQASKFDLRMSSVYFRARLSHHGHPLAICWVLWFPEVPSAGTQGQVFVFQIEQL